MEITLQCLLQFHYSMRPPRVAWIHQTRLLWTCCITAKPHHEKSCLAVEKQQYYFCSLLWRESGGPDSPPLQSGQIFSPIQNSCEIFSLLWKKSNLVASCGCVWLPSIRGTGKSRHKVSHLPDTLIPVSRRLHVICQVQIDFLLTPLGN